MNIQRKILNRVNMLTTAVDLWIAALLILYSLPHVPVTVFVIAWGIFVIEVCLCIAAWLEEWLWS